MNPMRPCNESRMTQSEVDHVYRALDMFDEDDVKVDPVTRTVTVCDYGPSHGEHRILKFSTGDLAKAVRWYKIDGTVPPSFMSKGTW